LGVDRASFARVRRILQGARIQVRLSIIAVPCLAALLVAAAPGAAVASLFAGRRPDGLGVSGGKLAPCRPTPNCVSSQASDPEHFVEPLRFAGTSAGAMGALGKALEAMEGVRIVRADPGYLHAEFTSRWLGFVDDVEFALDEGARVIHVRSASRLGRRDFGVNRARVEAIRARLAGA
jgi:uncharacterized protein (DUF1499 family)